ncbi:MAG: hypothetical protein AVDCRST_MAG73-1796, partial [uncultured Thermomicrobiales bacterium]
ETRAGQEAQIGEERRWTGARSTGSGSRWPWSSSSSSWSPDPGGTVVPRSSRIHLVAATERAERARFDPEWASSGSPNLGWL